MQRDGETPDAEHDGDEVRPEFEFRPAGSIPMPPRPSQGFFKGEPEKPVLITEAQTSLEQQHRNRVRRYTILMGFRIPCLILAAVAYSMWENWVISLLIIGVSIPLPWIAVLVANDRPPRRKDEPSRWDERRRQIALESGHHRAIDS